MPSPQLDLTAMAEKITYTISREHKDYLTSAGPGKLRSDASACPRGLDFDEVAEWLKEAVRVCSVSAAFDGDFPRYVWRRVGGVCTRPGSVILGSANIKDIPFKIMKLQAG